MLIGPALGGGIAQFAFERGDPAAYPGRVAIVDDDVGSGDRGRRSRHLPVERGERTLRRDQVRFHARKLGARRFHPLRDRSDAGQQPHIFLLEFDALLLGFLEALLALGEFVVEETQGLAGLVASLALAASESPPALDWPVISKILSCPALTVMVLRSFSTASATSRSLRD